METLRYCIFHQERRTHRLAATIFHVGQLRGGGRNTLRRTRQQQQHEQQFVSSGSLFDVLSSPVVAKPTVVSSVTNMGQVACSCPSGSSKLCEGVALHSKYMAHLDAFPYVQCYFLSRPVPSRLSMTLDSGVTTGETRDCEGGCRGRKRRAFRARLAAPLHVSGEKKRLEVSCIYPVILGGRT